MSTNLKVITSIALSAITALAIVYLHHNFVTGLNPYFGYFFEGVIFLLLVFNLILIFRIGGRAIKLVLLAICIVCVLAPFAYIKFRPVPHTEFPARRYFEAK